MLAATTDRHWRAAKWGLVSILVFFFLVVQFQYVGKIKHPTRSAVLRWHPILEQLDEGVNIWERYRYPNPPIMALILKPFTELPPALAGLTWFYFKVVVTIASLAMLFAMLKRTGLPFPFWAQAIALLLSLRPIEGDLIHGNVNLFILFLVVAGLNAFTLGRDKTAGFWIGLSIACKLTPALFVPYFLWKRAWTAVAATLVSMTLFLFFVPSLYLGWRGAAEGLSSWVDEMVLPFLRDGRVVSEHQNQSLPGFVHRLLTDSPSFSNRIEEDRYEPIDQHNIAEMPGWAIKVILKSAMLVFAALVVWRCRTPLCERTDARWMAEFSVILLGMLIFNERTWKHHCVMLLAPFATTAFWLARPDLGLSRKRLLGTLLVVSFVLYSATSTGWFSGQDTIGKFAEVCGAYLWGNVVLLGAMLWILLRDTPQIPATPYQLEHRRIRLSQEPAPIHSASATAPKT